MARIAKARKAHGDLSDQLKELMGEAVAMQFLADAKLVDEVEAAEDRGELGKHGGDHTSKIPNRNLALPTRRQAGLPPNKTMMEARKIRDAIKENPVMSQFEFPESTRYRQ